MPDAAGGGSPATDFSVALLGAFVRLGVRDIVLAPGSRSQGLALAAAELERTGDVRLQVRIDERAAAFLALGLAVESGRPALVVTTSGTAVANLHPAVLEAHHSGVPLILLTADRPAELRGIRSNQTTNQPGMFGDAVRLMEDVAAPVGGAEETGEAAQLARAATAAALGTASRNPGPVQLNLAFRDPLSAAVSLEPILAEEVRPDPGPTRPDPVLLAPGRRTIVVAGHGAGPAAEKLAREGGWPLVAEVSSGSRFRR
jgi:2-succinyl-5-enolpyruvyl-6-hydroxy-3-cyclohexene-1-carboxylate synthase